MDKGREWKIPLTTLIVNNDAPEGQNKIHVIEYAAFERLKSERDAAVFLLDKIANHIPDKNAIIFERAIIEAYAIEARAVLAMIEQASNSQKGHVDE